MFCRFRLDFGVTVIEKMFDKFRELLWVILACVSSNALGMQSGKIPNQAITASSFHDNLVRKIEHKQRPLFLDAKV